MGFEQAVELAQEPLGTWLYECWPDVVLFVSAFWVKAATYDLIRSRHRVVLLCTESPYEDDKQLERAAHADIVLLNDPTNIEQFAAVCDTVRYVPHSYDPAVHRPGPAHADKTSDLCIVGTGYQSRVEYLERMDLDGLDVALLGNWSTLDGHPLAKHVRARELDECVDNATAVDWYRSARASLNLYRRESNRPDLSAGWSMGPREIELAACRTFYVTERRGENLEVLPEVPKAHCPEHASDLLHWYLSHDKARERVIESAGRAVASYTFANRAAALLRLLER